jgi:hypothetical protein
MNRRRLALVATFVLPSAILLALAGWVSSRYRIEPPERLGPEARSAAAAAVRVVLEGGKPARPKHPELDRSLEEGGPVVVSVWHQGKRAARVEGRGERIADALLAAAEKLAAADLGDTDRKAARIQIDVVAGRAPLLRDVPGLELFALHAGIEGLGVETAGDEEHLLLPDELARARALQSKLPIKSVPDFHLGLHIQKADRLLAADSNLDIESWKTLNKRYFRFRSDSFVEPAAGGGAPLQLTRGWPPGPEVTAASLREAALTGGRYLVAHLAENGRYVYESNLATGKSSDPKRPRPYNLPRHAGTTYFLAELYRHTGEESLREPIERAFRHFAELVAEGGCTGKTPKGAEFACVHQKEDRFAGLGSTALAVVALVEYRRATGDPRYDDLARRLTEWILYLQRPDGSFAHRYDVKARKKDEDSQLLYFSGEAALALVRMYEVHKEERYRDGGERAIDWLMDWYDFFAGGFFFGEEHWTCIAAEAAWPAIKKDRYRDFCDDYAGFLRRQQIQADDYADSADLAGTYGVTPFVIPNNTPVGSRTEAMISSYMLGVYHDQASEPLRQQILLAMRYALGQQVRPDSNFAWVDPRGPIGALTSASIDPRVRIDYVQHICSAMIRTAEILDPKLGKAAR